MPDLIPTWPGIAFIQEPHGAHCSSRVSISEGAQGSTTDSSSVTVMKGLKWLALGSWPSLLRSIQSIGEEKESCIKGSGITSG